MDLVCPKCQGTMRTYERNGVHVDQCTDCRGIFLDRGELERLVDAENAWHDGPAAAAPSAARPSAQQPFSHAPAQHPQSSPSSSQPASLGAVVSEVLGQVRASSSGSAHGSYGKPRKKKSLISELFG
ncbi:TFIIB-type zinc ribbon-containing protein [Modestobacter sp. VKM Ac-2985]|uniref:TFIIB-type zinc ribbon-containing protein n=1 Tax=Modestobacter sp. VKM Ac-2985 TaxID=3004139 RepID=UPI0022ABBACB|nr:zf-TFIIB domain-containing protein [Modestobacter sp. VKM Ac-2985]MCZ2839447.1 zf-TFIIB domain-containing protein [Modestobacter sp. VKM Ac-2985]